jgi:hypothetical protein
MERKTGFEPATPLLARWCDPSRMSIPLPWTAVPSTEFPPNPSEVDPVVQRSTTEYHRPRRSIASNARAESWRQGRAQPNIEVIVPRAGAVVPVIAHGIAAFAFILENVHPTADVYQDLAWLHYDLAGCPLSRQLGAMLALTTAEHLHYGSDYPFTPEGAVTMEALRLHESTSRCIGDE